uniref:SPHK1 interactor, AKAP domain containing n=1 Tax=Hippocampus comes TaxID=109280 RepID=A0A3Q2ZCU6_HIPCM
MGVCLLQRSGQKRFIQPSSIIFEINRFLAGFQWGQEGQLHQGQIRQRVDDDTNRSVSSIEEDFLTASEHMGDDSEDDESLVEVAQKNNAGVTGQRGQLAHHQKREGADLKTEAHQRVSRHTKESAGYYATNLAESVLQDAFIRLSQDETSFISEAAVSVPHPQCHPITALSPRKQPSQLQTCSFELPKIVIVQSPDSADGNAEWPETQVTNVSVQDITTKDIEMPEKKAQIPHHNGGLPSKPVEVALACAANVIGTITSPQLARHLTQDSTSEEDTEAELEKPEEKSDYSFSSAICSMAQVAGAVAALELTDASGEGGNNDRDLSAVYTTSQGLISAAQTSAAFTLHCSVAEGTSVDAFRANIAEVFHREAAGVLTDPHGYRSVADLLESTHNKIVDGITCPKKSCTEESEVSELINEMADSLFKSDKGTFETQDLGTCSKHKEQPQHSCCAQSQLKSALHTKDWCGHHDTTAVRVPLSDIPVHGTERRGRFATANDSRQSSLTPQSSLNSCSSLLSWRMDSESRTPITCYADDLAATVVSMATELAAIYLENSTGKQPWFCALKGTSAEGPEAFFIPACRTVFRRKESQSNNVTSKKHRAPRLSEIKKKTEEQPELMERLVNRVVDESVNLDESQDPFALFASEVTARIMNCPELNVVDTSKTSQPRSRLQCERWSRGKASSYESIPEEDGDPSGTPNTLGPGSRLGQNLSRGSSISKQSSCESITDEFSRFMVNQMETEGRGFDLLLDYYAGKNASSILAAAVQQAASKKNGHLNVRTTSCLSKQSSTESITEEFYRFMLRDMDKENKEHGIAKTKEWSNSLFPPSPRSPFCIRQSSVPDRRSSDSRLTVNSPIKANSFDGFAQNVHGDTLNIYPRNSVAATGLCKSDSCLYQRGKTDQITDMLIHDTWSSSIESLMRKNKIIVDPEDSIDLEAAADPQPHIEQFANRLAADIVDIGKSSAGDQREVPGSTNGPHLHMPVGERRRGFKQSHFNCSWGRSSTLIRDQFCSPSSERDRSGVVVAKVVKRDKRSMSASSEESMGSWSHINTEDEPPDETSSFIQLSEGSVIASSSARKAGGGGCHVRELLVINCDLEADCMNSEVTLALEWIAASELGLQALYFKKSKEKRAAKFQKVVHLMSQKSWKIADLFDAVVRFCKLHEESEDMSLSSLFDWLLEIL